MKRQILLQKLNELGLTQKEFADYIGYSHQCVKQWRDGKIPIWVEHILNYLMILQEAKTITTPQKSVNKNIAVKT